MSDDSSYFLIWLHTSVRTLLITVRANHALIFATTHFSVLGTLGFHRHIPAVTLTDQILEGNIDSTCVAFEIGSIKIVADGDEAGVIQRKYPLDKVAGFNAVATKSGKILYDNTVDLTGLYHRQKFLHSRSFKVCAAVTVVYKFQDLAVLIFREGHSLFAEDQLLVWNTQTFRPKVL